MKNNKQEEAGRAAALSPEAAGDSPALTEAEAETGTLQPERSPSCRRKRFVMGWQWRLLLFWLILVYLEMLLRFLIYKDVFQPGACLRIALFSACYAAFLAFLSGLCHPRVNYVLAFLLIGLASALFLAQYFYFVYFRTPLLSYSIFHAGQVAEFTDQTVGTVLRHLPQALAIILPFLLAVPLAFCQWPKTPLRKSLYLLAVTALGYCGGILALGHDSRLPASPYNCYYNENNPPPTQEQLGMLTFMRLDAWRLAFGFFPKEAPQAAEIPDPEEAAPDQEEPEPAAPIVRYQPQALDIDFPALIAGETDPELLQMHDYFASQEPALKNAYTGLYEGCNLILITAESFSHYLLDTGMFPVLKRLATEGFEFTNFYTPLWNVSTSDGEYANLLSLLPKSGVWSMAKSAENDLPFTLAHQLRKQGYQAFAYHNHNYQYYDRQLSHPNLGYDYKAQGNGLDVTKIWPESDLQMMELSAPDYLGQDPFHVYYLTVSGHLEYNFQGNNMAMRHEAEVAELPYSEEVRAYIACNLELEYAMQYLLQQLEASGQLADTVIALTADHYPYGLSDEALDELAGHQVERSFEVYQNSFILWRLGDQHQTVDTPACSLDILPTLSNLFGLAYDSRLMMGRDIFSASQPLVVFNDRSWITDQGRYNAVTCQAIGEMDQAYIDAVNQMVNGKFTYSAMVLDKDYYRVLFGPEP